MFLKKAKGFLTILLLVNCINAFAQDSAPCNPSYFSDKLLNKLEGNWKLTGNIGNRKVENNFKAQWVLNHQFLQLDFADSQSPPTYTARVTIGYDCASEQYVMHWLDSFGGRYSKTLGYGVKNSDTTITFKFEYPDAPFVNEISYNNKNNCWHLHMTTKNNKGNWILFGDEYLSR